MLYDAMRQTSLLLSFSCSFSCPLLFGTVFRWCFHSLSDPVFCVTSCLCHVLLYVPCGAQVCELSLKNKVKVVPEFFHTAMSIKVCPYDTFILPYRNITRACIQVCLSMARHNEKFRCACNVFRWQKESRCAWIPQLKWQQ